MSVNYDKKLLEAMAKWKSKSILPVDFGTLLADATSPHRTQLRQHARQCILSLPHGKEILRKETRDNCGGSGDALLTLYEKLKSPLRS